MIYVAVDHRQRAVWGVGATPQAAMADVREVIKDKKPGNRPGELEVCTLSPGADLDVDGELLYQYVELEPTPEQGVLL